MSKNNNFDDYNISDIYDNQNNTSSSNINNQNIEFKNHKEALSNFIQNIKHNSDYLTKDSDERNISTNDLKPNEDVLKNENANISQNIDTNQDIDTSEDSLLNQDIDTSEDAPLNQDIDTSEDALLNQDINTSEDALLNQDIDTSEDSLSNQDIDTSEDALLNQDIDTSEDSLSNQDIDTNEDALLNQDIDSNEKNNSNENTSILENTTKEVTKYEKAFLTYIKNDKKIGNIKQKLQPSKFLPTVVHTDIQPEQTKKSLSLFSKKFINYKKITAIAAAFVLMVLGGLGVYFNRGGILGSFASEEIFGIFIDGNLVAAASTQEKIQESIDEFLLPYKTLEENESISNLQLSTEYEIRQLTKEEIKDKIFIDEKRKEIEAATILEASNEDAYTSDEIIIEEREDVTTQTEQQSLSNNVTQDGKIILSIYNSEIINALFYGSVPQTHTVKQGDNLSKIAKENDLTLTQLMVPNPDLLEDQVLGIDQQILIVNMSGPIKLNFSRNITITEEIAFETKNEETDTLYVGETKVVQEGIRGIKQEIIKYDYLNNLIYEKTPISNDVLSEPTEKIVQIGTKPKTTSTTTSSTTSSNSTSSSSKLIWPASGRVSSEFGPRKAPKKGASSYHRGIDIAAAKGTPIKAAASGVVTYAGSRGGYGQFIEINHGNGIITRYAHNSKLNVSRGQKVTQGQVIALMGSTGVSTGNHLHFEVISGGTAQNPRKFL